MSTKVASRISRAAAGAALVMFAVATAAPAQATGSVEKRASPISPQTSAAANKGLLIRRLLELTHAADRAVGTIEAVIPAQRAANPQVPKEFWDELLAGARGDTLRLLDMLVRVYEPQFTVAELQQLVAFYDSPLGRHLIQAQPVILAQSVEVGQQWGAQMSERVVQKFRERGIQTSHP